MKTPDADKAARLARVEAMVAQLAAAVDDMAEAVVVRVVAAVEDTRPIVLTQAQLQAAIKAAMEASGKRDDLTDDAEVQPTPPTVVAATQVAKLSPAPRRPKTVKPKATSLPPPPQMDFNLPSPSSLTLAMLDTPRIQAWPAPPAAVPPPPVAVHEPIAPPRSKPTTQPQAVAPSQSSVMDGRLYLWGNAWHHLPEDYEFPKESIEVMWRQWCCGVPEKSYRPLREIQASDIATTNNRKRLSDLKFLMKYIEQLLQERGVWKDCPSTTEADQMLLAVRDMLPFTPTNAKNGLKREIEDLKWHSAVTLLRGFNKKARTE